MADSILQGTKKALGIAPELDVFDAELIMHINSVLSTVGQLGVGPPLGMSITGPDDDWSMLLNNDPNLDSVKTYVYLKVRIIFDPPQASYLLEAMNKAAEEFAWRINVYREGQVWVPETLEEASLQTTLITQISPTQVTLTVQNQ